MGLGSLFGAIGLAALKAEIRAAGRRLAIAAVSGLLLVLAICFAVAGFGVWLAGEIGTVPALLLLAVGFLSLALLVQGIARLAAGRRRPRPHAVPPPPPPPPAAAEQSPSPDEPAPPGSELGVVATVSLLGFLLARQILRR